MLSVALLGSFAATLDNRPLELTARRSQGLLAYLAVERARAHYREALCELFWPNYPLTSARASLRQTLQLLRRAIGDTESRSAPGRSSVTDKTPIVLVSHDTVQINSEASYHLDVDALEAATRFLTPSSAAVAFRGASDGTLAELDALRAAVALYRGRFLEGFSLGRAGRDDSGDSYAFEEWLLYRREQYNRQMLLALSTLANWYEERGAWEEALSHARHIVTLDPWQEESQQQIMRLLEALGRRSEALIQYRRYRETLSRDLASEPGPDITALYDRLRGAATVVPALSVSPAEAAPTSPLSNARLSPQPLVAREKELAQLTGFLRQAMAGAGRVVFITGEVGSGKTSLMEEFARQAMRAHAEVLAIGGHCSLQHTGGAAYEAFYEALRMLVGESEGLVDPQQARRLQGALPLVLETLTWRGPDLVRWLARDAALASRAIASLPQGASWLSRLQHLTEQWGSLAVPGLPQATLREQVARVLQAIAQQRPILLILDDMQWADSASLDMLCYLGRHLERSRILVVCAYRSHDLAVPADPHAAAAHPLAALTDEFQRLWGDICIDLATAEPQRFVDAYLDSWPNHIAAPFRQTLAHHTGGNALFTVELVRAMQERGDLVRDGQGRWVESANLAWNRLPPRVEGAISYRIGQLPPDQHEILEVASVEGEQFHAEVLARVLGIPAQAVMAALSGPLGRQAHLVTSSGSTNVGNQKLTRYRFRHGMFLGYLYERLDSGIRAHWHGAVAAAIRELYAEHAGQLASYLARHQEEAGQAIKAAQYLLLAGRQVAWVGAHGQAINQYQKALGLLADKLWSQERGELESALVLALDESWRAVQGLGAAERSLLTSRAHELGRQLGATSPQRLRALRALIEFRLARGEHEQASELGHELLALATPVDDAKHISAGHFALALCALWQGRLDEAEEHVRQSLKAGSSPASPSIDQDAWPQQQVNELIAASLLWLRGYPTQARDLIERISSSLESSSQHIAAYIQCMIALSYAIGHDDRLARHWAEEALRTVKGRDASEISLWSQHILGWAEARAGAPEQGIARIRATMDAQLAERSQLYRYVRTALLAEAYLTGGQAIAALQVTDEALSQLESRGLRFYEAELWRLRGEALLDAAAGVSDACSSRECFHRAIEIAQQRGVRLLELRAATSLARLCLREGEPEKARETLAAVVGTFAEGLDTRDLVEARALLEQVHAGSLSGQKGTLPRS